MVTRLSKTRIHTDTSVAFQGPVNYAAAVGTDTYTADPAPAFTAYVTGAHYFISFTNGNTSTTPTLNLNSLGAKTIVKEGTAALSSGDIPAGHKGILMYDGTYLTLLNPKAQTSSSAIAAIRSLRIYAHATVPDTRFNVSFTEAVLLDSSNLPTVVRPSGDYEIICTTTGAGGMDTGSLAVSNWYYVWAIAKADGTNNVILSLSSSAPTMPSGYTYKALIGMRGTTAGAVLERNEQRGATVYKMRAVDDVVFSGAAGVTSWTTVWFDNPKLVPPNATKVSLLVGLNTAGTRSIGVRGGPSYGAGSDYGECASALLDNSYTGRAFKDVVIELSQRVMWIAQDTQAIYRMVVLDYTLGNINAD